MKNWLILHLYRGYTQDCNNTLIATFYNDTAISSTNKVISTAKHFQEHLNHIDIWYYNWKIKLIKINLHTSLSHFILENDPSLINHKIPVLNEIKYQGIVLDNRLTYLTPTKQKKTYDKKQTPFFPTPP